MEYNKGAIRADKYGLLWVYIDPHWRLLINSVTSNQMKQTDYHLQPREFEEGEDPWDKDPKLKIWGGFQENLGQLFFWGVTTGTFLLGLSYGSDIGSFFISPCK